MKKVIKLDDLDREIEPNDNSNIERVYISTSEPSFSAPVECDGDSGRHDPPTNFIDITSARFPCLDQLFVVLIVIHRIRDLSRPPRMSQIALLVCWLPGCSLVAGRGWETLTTTMTAKQKLTKVQPMSFSDSY